MSYYDIYTAYRDSPLEERFKGVSSQDVERAISEEDVGIDQLISLLSPAAESYLEGMASRAHETTLRYFGRTIQLYTPLYLSNYCDNQCAYCGFNSLNDIERRKLTPSEVEKEARVISATGLKHVLILTGESRSESPPSYIRTCVKILKRYFNSISIEIYPLTEGEYARVISEGADSLTIYQETYDEKLYKKLHPAGPKNDYIFRLDAPERGARAGMKAVNIGALLGLDQWRREIFFTALHADYIQDRFPDIEVGVSVPRLRPNASCFNPLCEVNDKDMVQIITALRIFLPRLGIAVSTRESPQLREDLLPLGVTRMSAGSTTKVGERIAASRTGDNPSQFDISDRRSVAEIRAVLEKKGYQAVLKDWVRV